MTTQGKEVLVDAHLLETQSLRPACCYHFLQGSTGRDAILGTMAQIWCGQCPAIYLAIGREG